MLYKKLFLLESIIRFFLLKYAEEIYRMCPGKLGLLVKILLSIGIRAECGGQSSKGGGMQRCNFLITVLLISRI